MELPSSVSAVRGETLSLTGTLQTVGKPAGYNGVLLNTTARFNFGFNPAIRGVIFFDASAAVGSQYIDVTSLVTDRATGTGTTTTMNSMQTGDALYIGLSAPSTGVRITIGNTNGNPSVLAAKFRANDATWTAVGSLSDGTDNAGATLNTSPGNVSFTLPTTWYSRSLADIFTNVGAPSIDAFWLELKISAAADSTTSITEIWSLNVDANYGYGLASTPYAFIFDASRIGGIVALDPAAGTPTLDITWIRAVK